MAKSKISQTGSIPVTKAASNSAQSATSKKNLSTGKSSGQPSAPKPKNKSKSSTPDGEGKPIGHINDLKSFVHGNMINPKDLPSEISPQRFHQVLHEVVNEKIKSGEKVTTSSILGDCFEKLGIEFQHIQTACADVLIDWTLPLIQHYLKEIVTRRTKEVLFNGAGGFSNLSSAKKAKLLALLDKASKANDIEELGRMGVKYASSFSIGTSKYKDAGFMIDLRDGEWLFLADVEFKTSGSKGINAQSATAFVRFAGVEKDEQITFMVNNKTVTTTIDKLLFNPTDLNSHIAAKAGKQDSFVHKPSDEIMNSKTLKDRLRSQKKERAKIMNQKKKTDYGDNIPDLGLLVTDIFKVGVDADLKGMRRYIYKFVSTL